MSQTLSGYLSTPVTLATGAAYANPLTIAATIESGSDLYIQSPWSVSITGTLLASSGFAIFGATTATIANSGYIHGRAADGIFLNGGAVENSGILIGGEQAVYGYYKDTTSIANSGYILGGTTGIQSGPGYITNASTGTIAAGRLAIHLTEAATLINTGLISAGDDSGIGVSLANAGLVINTGTIQAYTGLILHGGTLENAGFIQGETLDNNAGTITPSALATAIDFTAPGTFISDTAGIVLGSIIGDGGILDLTGGTLSQIYGFAQDIFAPGAHAALTASLSGLGTISGFTAGDELILTNETATSGTFLNNFLTLSDGATLAFAGSYARNAFHVSANPDGNTDITVAVPCFCAGTRIATPNGEIPVEDLRIGDLVTTLHAGPQRIKFIGTRAYHGRFIAGDKNLLPIRIAARALGPNTPSRDLFVSPGHALLICGALIAASHLVNATTITQLAAVETLQYFHIELATHEILFAESCAAESFLDENFRQQFQNAAEYSGANPEPASPCLPRTESGFLLHAITSRLATPEAATPGPLRGFIDQSGPAQISGWAQNFYAPETPVCLDIICNGHRLARILANAYRADLRQAGIGSGRHAFSLPVPPGITGPFTIRRAADGTHLQEVSTSFSAEKEAKRI